MTITFITGANKGLGHETARRLVEYGHTVLLGARDPQAGRAAAAALGARFVQIDVTDEVSVAEAAADVLEHEGKIDVLINNAGIFGPMVDPAILTAADVAAVLDVNVVGVVRATTAFLPLLRKSTDPAIVNVGSGMGSLELTHDLSRAEAHAIVPGYTASKAALTMLTTQYAKGIPDIRINVADPGYTATDLNGNSGPQTVTEGTDAIVKLATEGPGHGSGRLVDRHGETTWG
ncbi:MULTISPECIES: SDR family NAD(P)-dependent oxidoreductase [unclassified Nocardioides]|uniref:SDR family NAD(P)-dependent oxidoreductase n=1 Tax=unclassified Nocardioides TaxID=2615069 RepID=UPI000703497D|nr:MULTISPECIES: SDR family NAD(P)-dependent oxidoreductase [unclassified Nocardioides]KRC53116.1 short-chain dehydrogenase [Nocardioides sp. Root79]KRC72644.1 short-chain dehydrogenase [Nocardioides sp. Root240]